MIRNETIQTLLNRRATSSDETYIVIEVSREYRHYRSKNVKIPKGVKEDLRL